jgi:hypothetical protein
VSRLGRWRERHQREAVNRAAIRTGHGLVSMNVPPPIPAVGAGHPESLRIRPGDQPLPVRRGLEGS